MWGHDELAETAQLLVSELVTNAVLHSGTELELRATTSGPRVRIEVHDGSTAVPSPRHYDQEAATGQGIGMVEVLASAWGVQPAASGGKVVWFELGDPGPSVDPADEVAAVGSPMRAATGLVEFVRLPAALVHATVQYGDAVLGVSSPSCPWPASWVTTWRPSTGPRTWTSRRSWRGSRRRWRKGVRWST